MIRHTTTEPGNGARYSLVWGTTDNGVPFVAWPDRGVAATMSIHPVEHRYIMEKLGVSEPDAKAILDILNAG